MESAESKNVVETKRWLAILLFLIYDLLQIFIVGHIKVKPNENLIIRYSFEWTSEFTLKLGTIIILIVLPFIISYIFAVVNITGNSRMVQIIGPSSLMNRVEMEFHRGNPDGKELNLENIRHLLEDMAEGEPEGTIDNLEMLFSMGMLVKNLLNKAGIDSVKRVYISDELAPNAFTLRIIPIPYIGQDWIIINRNVIDILDQEEINAVVAHEVGHAARKDSWLNSFLFSPRLIIIFGWSVIFAAMASIVINDPATFDSLLRVGALILFFGFVRILMNIGYYFNSYAYRKTELLADYYAANLVGSEELINALVKIGQRGEVIRAINIELKWMKDQMEDVNLNHMPMQVLNAIDPSETSPKKAREVALEYYIRSRLSQTLRELKITITREKFEQMIEESRDKLLTDRGYQIEAYEDEQRLPSEKLEKLTKNWRSVDLNDNQKLDRDEIDNLVSELKDKNKKIFETEALEELGVVSGPRTHPQVSQRIKFLYDNLMNK